MLDVLVLSAFQILAEDPTPKPEDVKAGWTGFALFLGLIAVVVLLCFSFVKQMRKTRAAQQAGVFEDRAAASTETPETPRDEA